MNILQTLNEIGGVLGILSLVTAGVFVALNQKKNAEKEADNDTIKTYRANAESLNELLKTRTAEIAELQASHAANVKRIELAESKADILEKQVTQAPSINKLIMQMGKQHKEIMESMASMTGELGNIAKAIPKGKIHADT